MPSIEARFTGYSGAVTVTITRLIDDVVMVTGAAATSEGDGIYSYAIAFTPPTSSTKYKVVWTATTRSIVDVFELPAIGTQSGAIVSASLGAYVTISEAAAYFASDPRATAFLALSADMAWYLRRATRTIDELPLKGSTYYYFVASDPITGQQDKQFPRYIDGMCYGWNINTLLPEVPQEVLVACCEEALALYLFHADNDRSERKTMKDDGVKSYSLGGDYSENLDKSNSEKHKGLLSSEAWKMLSGYIAGAIEGTF
jgi:hypothetical protein